MQNSKLRKFQIFCTANFALFIKKSCQCIESISELKMFISIDICEQIHKSRKIVYVYHVCLCAIIVAVVVVVITTVIIISRQQIYSSFSQFCFFYVIRVCFCIDKLNWHHRKTKHKYEFAKKNEK